MLFPIRTNIRNITLGRFKIVIFPSCGLVISRHLFFNSCSHPSLLPLWRLRLAIKEHPVSRKIPIFSVESLPESSQNKSTFSWSPYMHQWFPVEIQVYVFDRRSIIHPLVKNSGGRNPLLDRRAPD